MYVTILENVIDVSRFIVVFGSCQSRHLFMSENMSEYGKFSSSTHFHQQNIDALVQKFHCFLLKAKWSRRQHIPIHYMINYDSLNIINFITLIFPSN